MNPVWIDIFQANVGKHVKRLAMIRMPKHLHAKKCCFELTRALCHSLLPEENKIGRKHILNIDYIF